MCWLACATSGDRTEVCLHIHEHIFLCAYTWTYISLCTYMSSHQYLLVQLNTPEFIPTFSFSVLTTTRNLALVSLSTLTLLIKPQTPFYGDHTMHLPQRCSPRVKLCGIHLCTFLLSLHSLSASILHQYPARAFLVLTDHYNGFRSVLCFEYFIPVSWTS